MSEVKDPGIKLFGKTISLPLDDQPTSSSLATTSHDDDQIASEGELTQSKHNDIASEGELTQCKHNDDFINSTAEGSAEPPTSSGISDEPKTQDTDKEALSQNSTKNEDPSDKALKKPDKIIPCPRCNSMETKFCYYNNYNVNQPRHFCKKCQRYWTAGGTMRNVPVGSGRRKNKCSSYRHIMVSDALQPARFEAAHGMNLPNFRASGTVLAFGSDKPLCDSMASVLHLAEKSQNSVQNGFNGSEGRTIASCGRKEIENDQSSGTCSTASNSTEKGTHDLAWRNLQVIPHQVHNFPGPPWPYPCNVSPWTPVVSPPALSPSGFPVSFYPAPPYWGCPVGSPWNVPWIPPVSASPGGSVHGTSPTSPTLGKHSREESMLNASSLDPLQDKDGERNVLIPKTLRIDDLDEAAKSSIWSTLGIKTEKNDSVRDTRLFKAFNSKVDEKNHEADTSLVLQANPAALSRSLNFHEST